MCKLMDFFFILFLNAANKILSLEQEERCDRTDQRKQHLIDKTHAAILPTVGRAWCLTTVTQIGGDNKSCCGEEQIGCRSHLGNQRLKYGQYVKVC